MRYHWETLLRAMRFVYVNFACRTHAFWSSRASLVEVSSGERTQGGYDGAGIASLIFIRFPSERDYFFLNILQSSHSPLISKMTPQECNERRVAFFASFFFPRNRSLRTREFKIYSKLQTRSISILFLDDYTKNIIKKELKTKSFLYFLIAQSRSRKKNAILIESSGDGRGSGKNFARSHYRFISLR